MQGVQRHQRPRFMTRFFLLLSICFLLLVFVISDDNSDSVSSQPEDEAQQQQQQQCSSEGECSSQDAPVETQEEVNGNEEKETNDDKDDNEEREQEEKQQQYKRPKAIYWEQDIRDDCSRLAQNNQCVDHESVFFECPVACAQLYQPMDAFDQVIVEDDDPDIFYEHTIMLAKAPPSVKKQPPKTISLERMEGYITIIAIVPLYAKGMANFYYELLKYLHDTIYPYTLEIIILPTLIDKNDHTSVYDVIPALADDANKLNDKKQPKNKKKKTKTQGIYIAKETAEPEHNPMIQYLEILLQSKKNKTQYTILKDRVTCYLVSATGTYVEKRISPLISYLHQIIDHYNQELK